MTASFNSRRPRAVKPISQQEADALVNKMRAERSGHENYREKSLKLHGWICAKCGREFELDSLHLLTVHHKDGNHNYNPPDGSNWENLCIYCHDDEHSRSILGITCKRAEAPATTYSIMSRGVRCEGRPFPANEKNLIDSGSVN